MKAAHQSLWAETRKSPLAKMHEKKEEEEIQKTLDEGAREFMEGALAHAGAASCGTPLGDDARKWISNALKRGIFRCELHEGGDLILKAPESVLHTPDFLAFAGVHVGRLLAKDKSAKEGDDTAGRLRMESCLSRLTRPLAPVLPVPAPVLFFILSSTPMEVLWTLLCFWPQKHMELRPFFLGYFLGFGRESGRSEPFFKEASVQALEWMGQHRRKGDAPSLI